MKIEGISAVVTGGASGLGEGTVRQLSALGAKVAVLDLQQERAEQLAKEVDGIAVLCDVSDASSVEQAMNMARDANGLCGIAVNCAGIAPAERILSKEGVAGIEKFTKAIHVNLIGSFNILRFAADDMQKRQPNEDGERGVIISTASVAAFEGQIGQVAYSASKGGIVSMTLPAARELARFGIRVLAIAPGLFKTPMMEGFPQKVQDALAATLPFPSRLGKPEEFAKLVQHMIENPILNGEVVRLDSALRLAPK